MRMAEINQVMKTHKKGTFVRLGYKTDVTKSVKAPIRKPCRVAYQYI